MMQLRKSPGMRILSLILSLAVVCTTFPITAFAVGAPEDTTGTIRAFDTLDSGFSPAIGKDAPDWVYFIKVEPNTPAAELPLPATLSATVERRSYEGDSGQWVETTESGTEEIPVTWKGERAYDPTTAGQFLYTPTLPEGYVLADGVRLPQIYIVVGSKLARSGTTHTASNEAELIAAFANAANGDTIQVTATIDLGTTEVSYSGKSVTLDLNNWTILYAGNDIAVQLTNGASLIVTDESTPKAGKLSATVEDGIAIGNLGTGTVTVRGGTVEAIGVAGGAVYNGSTGSVAVEGGTVVASGEGGGAIYNKSTGSVTISGGTVQATEATGTAVYNKSTGKITISGEAFVDSSANGASGTIYLAAVPTTGDKIILDLQGGKVTNTAYPAGFAVYFASETVTPENVGDYYNKAAGAQVGRIYPEAAVAEIIQKDNTIIKVSLPDAFDQVKDGETIRMTASVDLNGILALNGNKSVTLDLNGKTISNEGDVALQLRQQASLTIVDGSEGGGGKVSSTGEGVSTIHVLEESSLTLSGVRVMAEGKQSIAVYNGSSGSVTVRGSTVEASGFLCTAIENRGASVTIETGTVQAAGDTSIAIKNRNDANGIVTVSGGSVTASGASSNAIENGEGHIQIDGGSVTGDGNHTIYNAGTGSITVTGGRVEAGSSGNAIFNQRTGKITISGTATLTSAATGGNGTIWLRGVPTSGDTIVLDIQGGTVTNTATPAGYSVYFNMDVAANMPEITPDNLDRYYKHTGGTVGRVYPAAVAQIIREDTIKNYPSLEDAFENAVDGDTIRVVESTPLTSHIYLSGTDRFTLDLNGQTVAYYATGAGTVFSLVESTSLTIVDGSEAQTGRLTVSQGTAEGSYCAVRCYDTSSVTISGGTVEATGVQGSVIHNMGIGRITISGNAVLTNDSSELPTITFFDVPTAGDKVILDMQGGRVTNSGGYYAVSFLLESVTGDNVSDYFRHTGGQLGWIYPELPVSEGEWEGDETPARPATTPPAGAVIGGPVSGGTTGILTGTVNNATESGKKEAEATLNYQNATALTPEGLKAINEAAAAAAEGSGIKLTLKMQLDRVVNGSVRSRITVDPAKLATVLTGKIGLGLWLDQVQDARVAAVLGLFRQYYKNDFLVLSFEQEIPLGVDVEIAVKLDLSTFDVKQIVLYSYDGTKNSYTRIPDPNYWLDGNGYSHFTVPFGGSVVISEGVLAAK